MPISDQYLRVPLDRITVLRDNRQRKTVETEDLQKSLQQIGLINPIVVRQEEDRIILVAGERRLTAFRVLNAKGHSAFNTIPVRFAEDLTQIEAAIIELEENIKRRDLPWQDLVQAVAKLHGLHTDSEPDWSQAKTAQALSLTEGTISMYLKVEPHMEDSRISGCTTVRNAYDVLERRTTRTRIASMTQLLEGDDEEEEEFEDEEEEFVSPRGNKYPGMLTAADVDEYMRSGTGAFADSLEKTGGDPTKTPIPITIYGNGDGKPKLKVPASPLNLAEDILHGSFLEWAPTYSRRRFDFIHCDFPYGMKELGPQMQGNEHEYYEDSPEIYLALLDCLCENLNKIMTNTGWIIFWYAERMAQATREVIKFKAPSLVVQTHPLIWLHSDNSGISPDYRRRPRHIYDTALLISRGEDAQLIKMKSDAYACHTDHKLHPSTKPEPMLRYFFDMVVDNNTHVLDPTCGSGAALRAAESLGAAKVLGIEKDWNYCETARGALGDSRKKSKLLDQIFNSSSLGQEEADD